MQYSVYTFHYHTNYYVKSAYIFYVPKNIQNI